jgi:hypothetical protein
MQVIAEVIQEIRQEKAGDHTSQSGNIGIGLPRCSISPLHAYGSKSAMVTINLLVDRSSPMKRILLIWALVVAVSSLALGQTKDK